MHGHSKITLFSTLTQDDYKLLWLTAGQ